MTQPRRRSTGRMEAGPAQPDLARALAADLRELVADLGAGDHARASLAMLEHQLHRSVPAALGLTLVLPAPPGGTPVRVNLLRRAVQPEEVGAVLEVPLAALVPGGEGSVVFYAAHPRAFVHVGPVFGVLPGEPHEQPVLPTVVLEPGIEGLQDRTTVNRGLGVLLNRGHDLAGARGELQQRAEAARTDLAGAAQALLRP